MKNSILKIINEKYEKYSIGYSKIKCPKSEHFGVRHSDGSSDVDSWCLLSGLGSIVVHCSFFGRCPIFFSGKIDPAPSKQWSVRL